MAGQAPAARAGRVTSATAGLSRRFARVAAYREAAGITSPEQAVSPEPHHGNPELEHLRQEAIRALEIVDEAAMWAEMDRGQLEAHTAAAERAQATAPPDVSGELRLTARAEADALQQAADAQIRNGLAEAASSSALASELAARRQQLDAGNAQYEAWADQTRDARDNGNKAAAELNRRGHTQPRPGQQAQPGTEPQAITEWWPAADQEIAHVAPAWWAQIKAEQAASVQAGKAARREASARAIPVTDAEIALYAAGPGQPRLPKRGPQAGHSPETAPETEPPRTEAATGDDPDAHITEAEEAARRFADERASRQARSGYAARISRQAEAQPEAHAAPVAEAPADVEMEL